MATIAEKHVNYNDPKNFVEVDLSDKENEVENKVSDAGSKQISTSQPLKGPDTDEAPLSFTATSAKGNDHLPEKVKGALDRLSLINNPEQAKDNKLVEGFMSVTDY